MSGVTDQVLARRLRELVREGLVEKTGATARASSASYALVPVYDPGILARARGRLASQAGALAPCWPPWPLPSSTPRTATI
jgi:hypothetical protein